MGSVSQTPRLFTPLKIGRMELKHRIVMAPLTRFRADASHTHTDLAVQHYGQRAATPGTLLITEATFIKAAAGGYSHVPGIYTKEQIAAWKRVTDEVHAKGSYIFVQLWALGRAADPETLQKEGGYDFVSASNLPIEDSPNAIAPRPLTIEEIKEYVQDYRQAALNAIEAGFDGVELHSANGYLQDQFIQDLSNKRTDQYGGSVENRTRFALESVNAIVEAIGADRTGIRISPFSKYQGMGMADPLPTFSYLVSHLPKDLAYLHGVESRISGAADQEVYHKLDSLHKLWGYDKVFLRAGGYSPTSAASVAEEPENENAAVVFGRYFISNPDLPRRIQAGVELTPYNRDLFYNKCEAKGYVDYTDATPIPSSV